jgi:hypothetical protein
MKWKDRTDEEREQVVGSVVIHTPAVSEGLDVLRRLYKRHRKTPEGTCSFITGDTRVGKTTILNEFLEEVCESFGGELRGAEDSALAADEGYTGTMSVVEEVKGHGLTRPILKFGVDKKATYKSMLLATIAALGVPPPRRSADTKELTSIILAQARGQEVRLIIFDDCQHISENRSRMDPYEAADAFKVLMKHARVQVACVGLDHATDFLLVNGQLKAMTEEVHRMAPFASDLGAGDPFREFLGSLSDELPFDKPSYLDDVEMAVRIHMASQGYVGLISKIVGLATNEAIARGHDRVTAEHLAKVQDRLQPDLAAENPFRIKKVNEEQYAKLIKRRWAEEVDEMRNRRGAGRGRAKTVDHTRWSQQ